MREEEDKNTKKGERQREREERKTDLQKYRTQILSKRVTKKDM